jgi:CRISPR/Cas system-associated protein Csx1
MMTTHAINHRQNAQHRYISQAEYERLISLLDTTQDSPLRRTSSRQRSARSSTNTPAWVKLARVSTLPNY